MTCGLALVMLNLVNLQVHFLLWPLEWLFTTRMEQAELLLGQKPKGTEEPFWTRPKVSRDHYLPSALKHDLTHNLPSQSILSKPT